MKFSKAKMIERLHKEGRADQIDSEIMNIMNKLDGEEAIKNDFKALVHDEEEYFVRVGGVSYPVNKLDCE